MRFDLGLVRLELRLKGSDLRLTCDIKNNNLVPCYVHRLCLSVLKRDPPLPSVFGDQNILFNIFSFHFTSKIFPNSPLSCSKIFSGAGVSEKIIVHNIKRKQCPSNLHSQLLCELTCLVLLRFTVKRVKFNKSRVCT